ncbi:MAG: hypothetical protein ACK4WH_00885 [Phycisphaerales bacterium]
MRLVWENVDTRRSRARSERYGFRKCRLYWYITRTHGPAGDEQWIVTADKPLMEPGVRAPMATEERARSWAQEQEDLIIASRAAARSGSAAKVESPPAPRESPDLPEPEDPDPDDNPVFEQPSPTPVTTPARRPERAIEDSTQYRTADLRASDDERHCRLVAAKGSEAGLSFATLRDADRNVKGEGWLVTLSAAICMPDAAEYTTLWGRAWVIEPHEHAIRRVRAIADDGSTLATFDSAIVRSFVRCPQRPTSEAIYCFEGVAP